MGKTTVQCKNRVKRTEEVIIEWEDFFDNTQTIPEGFKSASQIAKEVNIGAGAVRVRMKKLLAEGKVEVLRSDRCAYYRIINEKE